MAAKVTIKGLSELDKKLRSLQNAAEARDEIESILLRGAEVFRDEAATNAPVRTGDLKRSLISKLLPQRARGFAAAMMAVDFKRIRKQGTDRRNNRYPYIVEYGSKEHEIRPAPPKQALALLGGRVIREVVRHPGFAARRYFRGAVSRKRRTVQRMIERELKALIERIATR